VFSGESGGLFRGSSLGEGSEMRSPGTG
jgi:hypothetical protein